MRYLIVRNSGLDQYLTLIGVKYKPLFESRVNQHNTVIIDETFGYDITLAFPNYIFEVSKILNSFSRGRLNKVFELNNALIYNKPIDKTIIRDLIILSRKDDFQKMTIPDVDKNGAIRIIHSAYSETTISQMSFKPKQLKDYDKLRTIIFNTTILPYVKSIIF